MALEGENPECVDFQKQLPDQCGEGADLLDLFDHPHVRECRLCRALVEDLETIRQGAYRRWERSGLKIDSVQVQFRFARLHLPLARRIN